MKNLNDFLIEKCLYFVFIDNCLDPRPMLYVNQWIQDNNWSDTAIERAFNWSDTPEGCEFWCKINNEYRRNLKCQ